MKQSLDELIPQFQKEFLEVRIEEIQQKSGKDQLRSAGKKIRQEFRRKSLKES